MKVVVILPTYNERDNIVTLLTKLEQVTSQIKSHTFSFLVVDDTSPDGTQDVVAVYQRTHPNVHMTTGKKQGLGKALLRGLTYASEKLDADILVQMDADLSHDPASLPKFIRAIDAGADFAVGSRYIPGGSIPNNWGLHRKIFSVIGNAIVRFGLGFPMIHDWTGGYRAYKREFFEGVRHALTGFSGYVFQIAFLDKSVKHGAHVVEIPIQFTDRRFGRSKIAPSEYIRNVLVYVSRERFLSIISGSFPKFLVVGTIGFIINTIILEVAVKLRFSPTLGSIVGAELAIISNFVLNNRWTFGHKKASGNKVIEKFFQFNIASLGGMLLQAGSVAIGTFMYGHSTYRVFYLVGVIFGLSWNYFMYSRIIWRK